MMQITFHSNVCFSIAPVYLEKEKKKINTLLKRWVVAERLLCFCLSMLSQAASNERWRARTVSLTVAQALTSSLRCDLLPEVLGYVQKCREKIKNRHDESFYLYCFFVCFIWSFRSKQGFPQSVKTQLMSLFSVCVCAVQTAETYYITIFLILWQILFISWYLHFWNQVAILFSYVFKLMQEVKYSKSLVNSNHGMLYSIKMNSKKNNS